MPQPQPIQEHPAPQPIQVQPAPQPIQVQPVPVNQPTPEPVKTFDLDNEINGLLKEFGIDPISKVTPTPAPTDNQNVSTDNQQDPNDKESIAKNEKITILLEKMAAKQEETNTLLGQERYEKEQYKMAAEKLQNKVSEILEQKTALESDENRLQVNDDIKDFVHFYNKRTKEKDQQTPDSVLTKRTLAEAVKIVEAITNVNLDGYLNQYYLVSNPQIPKI